MTDEQKAAHIRIGATRCPYCGVRRFLEGDGEIGKGYTSQDVYCLACGAGWRDHYTLSEIFDTQPPIYPPWCPGGGEVKDLTVEQQAEYLASGTTDEQKAKYLASGGTRCPYCDGQSFSTTDDSIGVGDARQDVSCLACGAMWHDYYKLTDVREIRPPGTGGSET